MESQEFIVLYTHQKMKKSKVWQDGILKVTRCRNKAILYDDKGGCLESFFLKCLEVKPGDDIESDRYLITIEEVRAAEGVGFEQDVIKEAPVLGSRRTVPTGRYLGYQPAGLRRKFPGFKGPRQVPKKVVIMEHGDSAAAFEAEEPGGPVLLSPFPSAPCLFAAVGSNSVNEVPADAENRVVHRDRDGRGPPFSSAASTPSCKINAEMPCEESDFCSPFGSVNKHSDSLLTSEPMKRCSLTSHSSGTPQTHSSGAPQSIRSRAQIVALLKSRPTRTSQEVNHETVERFPPAQPLGGLEVPTHSEGLIAQEEGDDVGTERLHCQRQSGNTVKSKSWWATCLSSQRPSAHSSTVVGDDLERRLQAQGDDTDLNLKDLLVHRRTQFLESRAENGRQYNEDKLAGDDNPSWDREGRLEVPSLRESSSSPATCSSTGNGHLLSESDVQEHGQVLVNQNDPTCVKGPILLRAGAPEVHECGTPGKGCEQAVSCLPRPESLQTASSLSTSHGTSDTVTDMFSESGTDNESLRTIPEPMDCGTQPALEVTFNLNSFETSDTEEESWESSRGPQDSEGWAQGTLPRGCGSAARQDGSCGEGGRGHWPLPAGEPAEMMPAKEAPPPGFCGDTCVGFDTGAWEAGGPAGDIRELGDTLSSSASSGWTNDVYADHEDASKSTPKLGSNDGFASLPKEPKGINMNFHFPHFLNRATNQTPGNNCFTAGGDLDQNDGQVLPTVSGGDSGVQLFDASQNHSEEHAALGQSNPQVCGSWFYPLGGKQPVPEDAGAQIPEPKGPGGVISVPHNHVEIDTAGEGRRYWSGPRTSSEPSGSVTDISLLKSLLEHGSALEGLEILRKKTACERQGAAQTRAPNSSPEAGEPLMAALSQARPKSPLNRNPQQCPAPVMPKENEAEPRESLSFLQFPDEENFPKGGARFNVEANFQAIAEASEDSIEIDSILDFPSKDSEYSRHLDYDFPSAARTSWEANKVTSPEQMSTAGPVSPFSLDSGDEDCAQDFSVESREARTSPVMKKFSSLENKDFQRLPLESSMRVPLVTLPPADGPPDLDPQSHVTGCDRPESSGSPVFNLCEDSVTLPFGLGPEGQREASSFKGCRAVTPGGDSLLRNMSAQSKWLKYQNTPQCNLPKRSRLDTEVTGGFFAESVSGGCFGDMGERQSDAVRGRFLDAVHVRMIRGMLRQQQQGVSHDWVSGGKAPSLNLKQTSRTEETQTEPGGPACREHAATGRSQEISDSELCFPSGQKVKSARLPRRQTCIPAVFQSPAHYKRLFASCLIEHLNILLFGLAQRLHEALAKVDISFYTSSKGEKLEDVENNVPSCHHRQPAKLVMVKKEGPNKGRLFYTCHAPKADQCKFFKWLEEATPGHSTREASASRTVLSDVKSIGLYLRSQKIPFYEECQLLVRKGFDFQRKQYGKLKKFRTVNPEFYNEPKSKLYLKLSRKESSSTYSKDDLWVVSKTLDFELDTFIACSAFFGPSSTNEVELLPLKGYFPSSWPTNRVFGAGKSYLLAVVVLFFVRLFEQSETPTSGNARPWKLLIASSTNVAVDRVLLGLLSLGFDKFVRVGSVRKIAKPVLPYSLHAGSGNASEQLKELHALMREDLTPLERLYVRRSIEQHKLGTNKTLLRQVCVVGVTCAACLFPCMNDLRFPVVVLDECSQVTEPASLLPIARFECEKLIVVGDPKQLPPTIQGSEAAHENGLEQTLFDRLCLMGHEPVLLRTQYRCHPAISAVANDLFYGGVLVNGVSEADRTPLLAWLPTLCFYSVRGLEQTEGDNSFHNVAEAAFTLKLIRAVLASGVPGSAVGVITLYRAQMCKLCHLLRDADSDPPEVKAVQVSTVDAFQGAEKEIVILSCVRTRQVGFIDSEKRMNVALTRGRRHLLIVGHLACLRGSRLWGRVIQHCAGREDGLQHASQCEPQLDLLLKDYFEKQAEEKQEEKSEKDKSRLQKEHVQNAKSCSRKCKAPGDAPATIR
ncbi:5'-3' DNA helicase ZGRF1 isoform X2 [Pteropus medius]|uniref:protein ZGRF1 isoform X2 n=1 Tax=Pteropus vampyrus TaxID=132908 RepID=UPI00196A6EE1|nr:protein ZGRF1 isoform X2 [Pteropus giganteus]